MQGQLQLAHFVHGHDHNNGIDDDVEQAVDQDGGVEIDAFTRVLVRPSKPCQVHGEAPKRIHECPAEANSRVDADKGICDVAECSGLENTQQEKTDRDFGERDLDFVYGGKGVEVLGGGE